MSNNSELSASKHARHFSISDQQSALFQDINNSDQIRNEIIDINKATYDKIWYTGLTDGTIGQPKESGVKVVISKAAVEWQKSLDNAYLELADDTARMEENLYLKQSEHDRIRIIDEYLNQHNNQGRHFMTSLAVSIFYFIVSMSMILADIPVTLYSIKNIFNYGEDDQYQLYMISLLAGAISLSGMYIKYYFDEVDSFQNKKIHLHFITFLLIVMLLFLGLARYLSTDSESSSIEYSPEFVETVRTFAFTLLTVMLPVIGGMIFYAGLKELKFFIFQKQKNKTEERYNKFNKSYEHYRNRIAAKTKILELEEKNQRTKTDFISFFTSIYEHGYARGVSSSRFNDSQESLYDVCERTLLNSATKKM